LLFLFLLLTALFFQLLLQLKLIYIIQLLLQLQLTEGTLSADYVILHAIYTITWQYVTSTSTKL